MSSLYNDQLSPQEATLGYIRAYVSNPQRHFYANGSIVPAVIRPIAAGLRLIKLSAPDGTFSYPIQGYGSYGVSDTPDWKPIISGVSNPKAAILSALKGIEVPFTLAVSSINLRCPKCHHEFDQQADHLPADGTTKCPKCGHEADTGEFNAVNL
jgi:hypothetical protein